MSGWHPDGINGGQNRGHRRQMSAEPMSECNSDGMDGGRAAFTKRLQHKEERARSVCYEHETKSRVSRGTIDKRKHG